MRDRGTAPVTVMLLLLALALSACSTGRHYVVLAQGSSPEDPPSLMTSSAAIGSRIRLELRDGRKLDGHLQQFDADSLTIREPFQALYTVKARVDHLAWRDVTSMEVEGMEFGPAVIRVCTGVVAGFLLLDALKPDSPLRRN